MRLLGLAKYGFDIVGSEFVTAGLSFAGRRPFVSGKTLKSRVLIWGANGVGFA